MALTVKNVTNSANITTRSAALYSGPAINGPARPDITVTMLGNSQDASYIYIYVQVAGTYNAAKNTGTPIDSAFTMIGPPIVSQGFSVITDMNRVSTKNPLSVFLLQYDLADGWPTQFQAQTGKNSSQPNGTQNTVYVFTKGGIIEDDI